MRKYKLILMALLSFNALSCRGQDVSVTITVLDQSGKKVPDVEVGVSPPASLGVSRITGFTNDEGKVDLLVKKMPSHTVGVAKKGYYGTAKDLPYEISYQSDSGSMIVEIKEIKNPIAMYAKNLLQEGSGPLKVPVESEEIGYDLKVGDWVAPHGRGIVEDLIFFYESEFQNRENYSRSLRVRFSNEKDGIVSYEATIRGGSVFVRTKFLLSRKDGAG